MPKVSVVISTYNRPKLLKRCLDSVRDQTFADFECLVMDDGSEQAKDNQKLVAKYDERFKYHLLPRFGNHSRPKNEGTRISTGDFIAYLDDDVEFRPDHLAVLVNELEGDPSVALVYGQRMIYDEVTNEKPRLGVTMKFEPFVLMRGNYIDTSDVLIRRQAVFDVGGWDEGHKKFLDWNLWVRMVKYGFKFKGIQKIITNYYLTKGSMSFQVLDSKGPVTPAWNAFDCDVVVPYLKEIKEPKIAVFSLTYNRLSETTVSFASMHETADCAFTHVVVDNGSSDGTLDWLKEYAKDKDVKLILNSDNKGISLASNQAVDWILSQNYDIVVKSDNDAIYKTKGWLKKMVDLWKSNRNLAMSCYVSGLRDNPGGSPRIEYGEVKGEMVGITKHLGGICHFVDAKAYKNFRWPTDETLHGSQDLEFSMYLGSKNYTSVYLENYYVNHGIDGTAGQEERYKDYFEKRKWEKCHRYGDK